TNLPHPEGDAGAPLKALLVDSWYDTYLGVMVLVRIIDGTLKKGMRVTMMAEGTDHYIDRVGVFKPTETLVDEIGPGEVGFFTASIKEVSQTNVGDTITEYKNETPEALPGFKPVQSVVFCGLFPADAADFEVLRESMYKLRLNDASFEFETETSAALGYGFRCGFLGMLHLEIIQERLMREFDLDIITTSPSVIYRLHMNKGSVTELHNPADMPDQTLISHMEEPWIKATILVPDEYLGPVLTLCQQKRGEQIELTYAGNRAMVVYHLPLNEVVYDFYDKLKSITRGYASFDYKMSEYREGDLVKLSILVNAEPVDALSMMVHRAQAEYRGRALCERLKDLIPRQLFKIPIQAAIGGKVIARETISGMRKDVTAKCYGGDISRKRKLLEKQKKGKKKMRQYGKVDIPHTAFIAALKMGDDK
ncbi:MAG: translation elongation factor 4, partial [Emcibacteraceae bacterium]|nr:translation elongation factor 4 [Emcibacteraceae bacterium]